MKLHPDSNPRLRALLYVIGCGGLLHLTVLLIIAIRQHDAAYFHPLYTIDADQLWPGAHNNWFVYVGGWIIFISVIYLIYRSLKKRGQDI